MRSILINYYYDVDGHFVMPGYIEVDQYGVYPVDNYKDNRDSIYENVKYFIENYSEYITQKAEDELSQKLDDAYNNLEDKEFYKVVEEIFDYFTKVEDEEVEFKVVNDDRITTKITVIRDSYHEVGYILDRLGEEKNDTLRPIRETVKLETGKVNKYNYEVDKMFDFYSNNVKNYNNYSLGLIDYKQSPNSMLLIDKLRFNKKKIMALGMASLVLVGGISYFKSTKDMEEDNKNVKSYGKEVSATATMPTTVDMTFPALENLDVIEPTHTVTVEPTKTVDPTVTPTIEPTNTPTVKPTATPTIEPTVAPTEKPLHFEELSTDPEIIAYSYENGSFIPHNINDAAYSDVTNMIYINNDIIYDLSNYIADPNHYEITKTGFIIDFEKYFTNCSVFEQGYIKHFSSYLKDMIYQCYVLGDFEEARKINMMASRDVIKYIINDETFEIDVDGTIYEGTYTDLSKEVRDVLESLSWNFCTFLGDDVAAYNGEVYSNGIMASNLFGINSNVLTR